MPAAEWSSKGPRRLGGQAKATLHKLFQHTPHLSRQLVDEVCAVHKVSGADVQSYMAELRAEKFAEQQQVVRASNPPY